MLVKIINADNTTTFHFVIIHFPVAKSISIIQVGPLV